MDFANLLATDWFYLLIAGAIGVALGWLIGRAGARRQRGQYEVKQQEVEAQLTNSEQSLVAAQQQIQTLRSNQSTNEASLTEVASQLEALKSNYQLLEDEKTSLSAALDERASQVEDLEKQLLPMGEEMDTVRRTVAAAAEENMELRARIESNMAELTRLRDTTAIASTTLSSKDIAMDEAFSRAAKSAQQLQERDEMMRAATIELSSLRAQLDAAMAERAEMERRLKSSRGDVASEMALVTATMMKMREDALAEANARIAELTTELSILKASSASGNQPHEAPMGEDVTSETVTSEDLTNLAVG